MAEIPRAYVSSTKSGKPVKIRGIVTGEPSSVDGYSLRKHHQLTDETGTVALHFANGNWYGTGLKLGSEFLAMGTVHGVGDEKWMTDPDIHLVSERPDIDSYEREFLTNNPGAMSPFHGARHEQQEQKRQLYFWIAAGGVAILAAIWLMTGHSLIPTSCNDGTSTFSSGSNVCSNNGGVDTTGQGDTAPSSN